MKQTSSRIKNMTAVSVGVAAILTSGRWPEVFPSTRRRVEAGDHTAQEHALMS